MPPKASKAQAPKSDGIPNIPADTSFTPESFERELKALAAKAKQETSWGATGKQVVIYSRVVLFLALGAASANASVASLSPAFGGIPSNLWHSTLVATALFAGWSSNLHIRRLLPENRPLALWLPLLAAYAPVFQTFLAPPIANQLGARWGPVAIEALTLFPVLAASISCAAMELEYATNLDEVITLPKWIGDALPGIGSWSVYKLAEAYTIVAGSPIASSSPVSAFIGWLQTRVARQVALALAYCLAAPSRIAIYAIPALLHTLVLNAHLAGAPWALDATNRALQQDSSDQWVVLDRRESITGYVSVVESLTQGFRVLRCDHSLLGGEWTKYAGKIVAEPIYGVFVMMEAVRLVERLGDVPNEKQSALVIGMGIGTAPAALVAHGIDTTVVEIDPVVNDFANRYFQLPSNHTAVVEDAVTYTDRLVSEQAPDAQGQFDYIMHDVFTGGAEPISLFTVEFLQNLHSLLKPSGVIAINYAGDFTLTPIKAVVLTIRSVFPACRIFREHPRDADATGPDFANVIVFCTKSGSQDSDIVFRQPVESDLLQSQTRRVFLVPKHEVFDSNFQSTEEARIVRRNDTEQLAQWHAESAIGHWTVMRGVIPPKVWAQW